ncbi:MAG: protein kinase [Acidobacteria bacterium]|nr:protein kinase [Acidobacteriota bacterium]
MSAPDPDNTLSWDPRADPPAPDWTPRQIGPYRIHRELGRGGMGVVYQASRADNQFRKQVAIKVLQGSLANPEMMKRFRLERQVLAGLEHPNIARLLDGGATEQGEPYFVMEYVSGGLPLDHFADQKGLGVHERLKLFLDVCAAVQYAHQHLVVHRDLKPGNILVNPEGHVKLVDFGIAKPLIPGLSHEEIVRTLTGAHAMTPEFASPEQIRGESIGVATDVYTLGVVLYQILTGELPFSNRQAGIATLMREVCEKEPQKPSTRVAFTQSDKWPSVGIIDVEGRQRLARKLSGDLDNIVMMALRKEVSRRYASVEQLAEDIRRAMGGQPVQARPATPLYMASKLVQRHPGAIAACVLLMTSLVGGIISTSRQAAKAEAQAREALMQRTRAEELAQVALANQVRAEEKAAEAARAALEADRQRQRAGRRLEDVQNLAGKFLFEMDQDIRLLPGATPVRKKLVDKASQLLSLLSREEAPSTEVLLGLALAYNSIGVIQRARNLPNLGDAEGAKASYLKALAVADALRRKDGDSPRLNAARMNTFNGLGDVLSLEGESRKAASYYRQALDLSLRLAADPKYARDPIRFYDKLANMHLDLRENAAALEKYQLAAEYTQRRLARNPDSPAALRDRMVSLNQLGAYHKRMNNARQALRHFEQSLAIVERLLSTPEKARYLRDSMVVHALLGWCWYQLGSREKALEEHTREAELATSLFQVDSKNILAHHDLSSAYTHIARLQRESGKLDDALRSSREALRIAEEASRIDAKSIPSIQHRNSARFEVALTLEAAGDWPEAERIYSQTVTDNESLLAGNNSEGIQSALAHVYTTAADFHRNAARHSPDPATHHLKARKYLESAILIHRKLNDDGRRDEAARKLAALLP